ncbi:MAG: hypothetical protein U9N35_03400 [Euryarchaeota archaeon]|nr:hypothetical protein [Euryarchaeota archaeon]
MIDMRKPFELNRETKIFFFILVFISSIGLFLEHFFLYPAVGALIGFGYLYDTGRLVISREKKYRSKDHFLSHKVDNRIKSYPLTLLSILFVSLLVVYVADDPPHFILAAVCGAGFTFFYFEGTGRLNICKDGHKK